MIWLTGSHFALIVLIEDLVTVAKPADKTIEKLIECSTTTALPVHVWKHSMISAELACRWVGEFDLIIFEFMFTKSLNVLDFLVTLPDAWLLLILFDCMLNLFS